MQSAAQITTHRAPHGGSRHVDHALPPRPTKDNQRTHRRTRSVGQCMSGNFDEVRDTSNSSARKEDEHPTSSKSSSRHDSRKSSHHHHRSRDHHNSGKSTQQNNSDLSNKTSVASRPIPDQTDALLPSISIREQSQSSSNRAARIYVKKSAIPSWQIPVVPTNYTTKSHNAT